MFKWFRMMWRGIRNALFDRVSPELMAEEAKEEIRQSTLATVESAQAAEVQAVKAERMLAGLIADREKVRLAVKRAMKAGNEQQATLFAEQVARLDQQIASTRQRVEQITAQGRNARVMMTQRVQMMAIRQLEIDGYVQDIHLANIEKQLAEDTKRMVGLLRDNKHEAYDRLRDRAQNRSAEAEAARRVSGDLLATTAAQAELEMRTPSDDAEKILAEVRAELGMATPAAARAAAPPESMSDEETADMLRNIMKETV